MCCFAGTQRPEQVQASPWFCFRRDLRTSAVIAFGLFMQRPRLSLAALGVSDEGWTELLSDHRVTYSDLWECWTSCKVLPFGSIGTSGWQGALHSLGRMLYTCSVSCALRLPASSCMGFIQSCSTRGTWQQLCSEVTLAHRQCPGNQQLMKFQLQQVAVKNPPENPSHLLVRPEVRAQYQEQPLACTISNRTRFSAALLCRQCTL